MIVTIDEQLRSEARRYHFVFACPDCAHREPVTGGCALGYPTEPHDDPDLEDRAEVTFCKTFELV